MPRVTVATKPVGTEACSAARSRSDRMSAGSSTTGAVFAIATMPQKPPAAAARVPVSMSSRYS